MRDQYRVNGILYRQQFRKCGKPTCKCQEGELHGPYWYAYENGSPAKYVGQQLPEHVANHEKMLKSAATQIRKLETDLTKKKDDLFRQYKLTEEQLRALQQLRAGERVDPTRLIQLGLSQFNGHEKGGV